MKRLLPVFVLMTMVSASMAADLTLFPFTRELHPPASGDGEMAGVTLDPAVYAVTDDPQTQLRILDPDNRETPFHVRKKSHGQSAVREIPFPAEVLSFRQLPDNRAEILVKRDSRQPIPAGLQIHSSKRNFEKQVTVSGSADRQTWILLAEAAPIFDYSRFIDVRNDRVSFTPGDFIFFKIEVSNIAELKDSPLTEIIRTRAGDTETRTTEINAFRKELFRMDRLSFLEKKESFLPSETETRDHVLAEWSVVLDAQRHQTVVTFNAVRQPLTALTLDTAEVNFSRPVSAAGADTPKGPWTDLASGRISRIDAGKIHQQSLTLPLNGERRYRHYRILIDNQDNPPLAITGIRARENLYEALFFPKPDSRYRLYYGGHGIKAPSYDTETVLSAVPPGTVRAWAMGEEQKNPKFKPGLQLSWLNSKSLLMAAIVLMVGVLAWTMVRVLKKVEVIGRD